MASVIVLSRIRHPMSLTNWSYRAVMRFIKPFQSSFVEFSSLSLTGSEISFRVRTSSSFYLGIFFPWKSRQSEFAADIKLNSCVNARVIPI